MAPKFLSVACIMTACTFIGMPARAGFNAEILDAWASPASLDVGEGTTLNMRVRNRSTADSGYNGYATFTFEFEVDVPGQYFDDDLETVRELAPNETRTIALAFNNADNDGTYSVEARVESRWEANTFDRQSFTFTVRPDPCEGITCSSMCVGDHRYANGRCSGGDCIYDVVDCNAMDVTGNREYYCDGSDVRSHRRFTDYSCRSGSCTSSASWTSDRWEDGCDSYCDGATSVWGRTCSNGACTTGARSNCDAMDMRTVETYCNGNAVWEHTRFVDFSCVSGVCDDAPAVWTNEHGLATCAWGCSNGACRTDPCAGVACPDTCGGNIRYSSGYCADSRCVYRTSENCDTRDTGASEQYCTGNDVYARERVYDYSCVSGRCAMAETTRNERRVASCADACTGSTSTWGRTCSSGQCTAGATSDCNLHDTTTSTARYCDGSTLRAYETHSDFSCDTATGRCDSGREVRSNDRLVERCAQRLPQTVVVGTTCIDDTHIADRIATSTWGCARNACNTVETTESPGTPRACAQGERCEGTSCEVCTSEWMCGSWDRCDGRVFRTRACVDANDCPLSARPVEFEYCPCDVTDIKWINGGGQRLYEAIDGDAVVISVEHEGHCAGMTTRLEIWDDRWGPLTDRFVQDTQFTFTGDGSSSLHPWQVVFDYREGRGWGHYHYEVRLPAFDEESGILDVGPYQEEGGEAIEFLTTHAPEPYTTSDDLCFRGAHVTITDRCRELWERANLVTEIESEESVRDFFDFFLGESTGWIIYNSACTLCGFGSGPAAAVCIVPDGGEFVECPLAAGLAVCDTAVCLGFLGRYVGRVAGALWGRILKLQAARVTEAIVQSGARTILDGEFRDDIAHFVLQNADDEVIDVFARIDPSDPRRIIVSRITNHLNRYAGGGEFLRFNGEHDGIIIWDVTAQADGGYHGLEIMSSLFQDGAFEQRFNAFIPDLSGSSVAYDDLLEVVTFTDGTAPGSYAGTYPIADSTRSGIRFYLRTAWDSFWERTRRIILHYTLPHELGHAVVMRHVRSVGYTIAPTNSAVAQALYPAADHLNDVFTYTRIREPYRGEFYDRVREVVRDDVARGLPIGSQNRLSKFVNAMRTDSPGTSGAYSLVLRMAQARRFGLSAEETTIRRMLNDALASESPEFRERALREFERLTTELMDDAQYYADHALDGQYDERMLTIMCSRYQLLTCPHGGGEVLIEQAPGTTELLSPDGGSLGEPTPGTPPLAPAHDGTAGYGELAEGQRGDAEMTTGCLACTAWCVHELVSSSSFPVYLLRVQTHCVGMNDPAVCAPSDAGLPHMTAFDRDVSYTVVSSEESTEALATLDGECMALGGGSSTDTGGCGCVQHHGGANGPLLLGGAAALTLLRRRRRHPNKR